MKFQKLLHTLLFFVFVNSVSAQHMMTISADDAVIMNETMAVLIEKDGKLVVEMMPPVERISKQYKNVDMKKGDKILFCNGKKIKSASQFRSIYESLKTGEEMKIGVQRGDERFIIVFPKADVSKHKGMKIMRMDSDEELSESDKKEIKKQIRKQKK